MVELASCSIYRGDETCVINAWEFIQMIKNIYWGVSDSEIQWMTEHL